MVLDMPDLATELCQNPVDWGSTGYIATIYKGAVYFWNPEKKTGFTYLDQKVKHCIKWNQAGTQLGVSLAYGSKFAILDFRQQKITAVTNFCLCNISLELKRCEMCCIEWTSSKFLITGCSRGTICLWSSHDLKMINGRKGHHSKIIKMSLSCKEKYLVTIGSDNIVMVWSYPRLEELKEFNLNITPTRAIAWHPWKESLLAIGDVKCFYILNVQSDNVLRSSSIEGCWIHNLTFNPRSGELLLSIFDNNEEASYLRVMRNLDTVVDDIRCNEDIIISLLWDSTGTKLGTVSTDEYFCIWSFFGKSTKLEKKYLNKERKGLGHIPSVNNFCHTIR
ncbi:unnamed protein product [Psylliodes chrysocephalus]|uniref:Uncharacterized protein n=1 Tax=Psylliodes chrysocephalus TaxID=3402493 RepID=A0A9P0CR53_9CUCU|nr:unnamed protein product [Psylliodes chrysocephala]